MYKFFVIDWITECFPFLQVGFCSFIVAEKPICSSWSLFCCIFTSTICFKRWNWNSFPDLSMLSHSFGSWLTPQQLWTFHLVWIFLMVQLAQDAKDSSTAILFLQSTGKQTNSDMKSMCVPLKLQQLPSFFSFFSEKGFFVGPDFRI